VKIQKFVPRMADKQEFGEVGAYILFSVFTILVFPVAGPAIMYSNWNDYAEKLDWVPGTNADGGVTSGAVTFVYVLVWVALVGSVAVGISSGVSGFTSPVEAGQQLEVDVKVENLGGAGEGDVELTVEEQ